jgi:hypothetical protein
MPGVGSIFFFLCEYGSHLAKTDKIVTAVFMTKLLLLLEKLHAMIHFLPHIITNFDF